MLYSVDAIFRTLFALRWDKGPPRCPVCDQASCHRYHDDPSRGFHCYKCVRSFTAITGTPLHNCKMPLPVALEMAALLKQGVSINRVAVITRHHYRTANRIAKIVAQSPAFFDILLRRMEDANTETSTPETNQGGKVQE